MNREIKFRAWDIGKKVFIPTDVWAVVTTNFAAFGMMLEDWEDYRGGEFFYKDTQVLMQYTGLKDRNGVDIYESDIVTDGVHNGVVFYNTDSGQYQVDFEPYEECPQEMQNKNNWAQVVGNIYENPELLK